MPKGTPSPGTKINRLDHVNLYRLTNYVGDYYVTSGFSDREFAAECQEAFGLPLTEANILAARQNLGLAANYSAKTGGGASKTAASRIDALIVRMKQLEDRVEVYLKGARGDRK